MARPPPPHHSNLIFLHDRCLPRPRPPLLLVLLLVVLLLLSGWAAPGARRACRRPHARSASNSCRALRLFDTRKTKTDAIVCKSQANQQGRAYG
eukprot:COSAG06_NODE_8915_length_2033_cov_2.277663_3_plen_94_part_00